MYTPPSSSVWNTFFSVGTSLKPSLPPRSTHMKLPLASARSIQYAMGPDGRRCPACERADSRIRGRDGHAAVGEPLPGVRLRLGQPSAVRVDEIAQKGFVVEQRGEYDICRRGHCGKQRSPRQSIRCGSRFISIDVLAIARRSSGLCCDMSAPTRRPFAQKLSSVLVPLQRNASASSLFAHAVYDCSSALRTATPVVHSPCILALSNRTPSSFSTSRLSMLVNGCAWGKAGQSASCV